MSKGKRRAGGLGYRRHDNPLQYNIVPVGVVGVASSWSSPDYAHRYADLVMRAAPIAYWRLDEASGTTTAICKTDSAYNGTYGGNVTLGQTGALSGNSRSVLFDGVTGQVTSTASGLRQTIGAASIECWVKRIGSSSDAGLAGTDVGGIQLTWHLGANIYFYVSGGGSQVHTPITDTTGFHHVVGTWDGTTGSNGMKLYVDGALTVQGAATSATLTPAASFSIGKASTFFNGYLDEVALYNYVLSAQTITDHYNAR